MSSRDRQRRRRKSPRGEWREPSRVRYAETIRLVIIGAVMVMFAAAVFTMALGQLTGGS